MLGRPGARWARPAVVDAALATVLVAAAVAETAAQPTTSDPRLRAMLAGATVAGLAFRRIQPTLAAGWFGIGMTAESLATESPDEFSVLLACLVVSYSVARYAPRREAFLGGALLALALAVTIGVDPSDSLSNVVPSAVLFIGLPFALGMVIRRGRQDVAALTLEAEALAREADLAVDVERRRIARELHDVVSHAVTVVAVQAEAGQAVLDSDPDAARHALESIGQVSREALEELAHLLAMLHERDEESDAGLGRIPMLVECARAAGMMVTVTGAPGPDVSPALDRCAYRVVQEGLTNALRHSSRARVDVAIDRVGDDLVVTVQSEGRRHTSAYGGTGRGLAGMRERVLSLGGVFEAGPFGEQGFAVRAALPLSAGRVAEGA